jgi:O-antigen ligase
MNISAVIVKFMNETANIKMTRVFPLVLYIIICFVDFSLLGSSKSSPVLIEVQANPYRKIIYALLYFWSGVIVLKNRAYFRPIISDLAFPLLFLCYALSSLLWSKFPTQVLKDSIHLFGTFLIAISAISDNEKDRNRLVKVIFVSTTMVLAVSILSIILYPHNTILFGPGDRWRGITPHANSLGAASLLCIISSIVIMFTSKKIFLRMISLLILFLSFLCLIKSNSMTCIVISIESILLSLLIKVAHKYLSHEVRYVSMDIKIMSLLWLILLPLHFTFIFHPELFTVNKFLQIMGRTQQLTGRLLMWEMGLDAAMTKPILGWGYDGLLTVKEVIFGTTLPYYQIHNGYLNLIILSGIVGGAITLLIIIITLKRIWVTRNVDRGLFLFAALFLFAFLLHNVTESSIFIPTSAYWVLFLCIYLQLGGLKKKLLTGKLNSRTMLHTQL